MSHCVFISVSDVMICYFYTAHFLVHDIKHTVKQVHTQLCVNPVSVSIRVHSYVGEHTKRKKDNWQNKLEQM